MQRLLLIALVLYVANAKPEQNLKQQALKAVEGFFNIQAQRWILDGRFVGTDPEYGESCQVVIDFSKPVHQYLSLIGQYTPAATIGDGINFNADADTFVALKTGQNSLSIKQKFSDDFASGVETSIQLNKNGKILQMTVNLESSFLFISSSVEKKCVVDNFITYR